MSGVTDINWHSYRVGAWFGLVLLAITVVLGFIRGYAGNALIFVAFFGVTAAVVTLHRKFPAFFSLIVVLAGILSGAGWAWNWYTEFRPYDEIAHAVSTMALTLLAAFYLYRPLTQFFRNHLWLLSVTLLGIGLAIGAAWEIVEYFFISGDGMKTFDLITDLMMDALGALAAVPISIWAVRQAPETRNA